MRFIQGVLVYICLLSIKSLYNAKLLLLVSVLTFFSVTLICYSSNIIRCLENENVQRHTFEFSPGNMSPTLNLAFISSVSAMFLQAYKGTFLNVYK